MNSSWDFMYMGVEHDELLLKTADVGKMLSLAKTTLEHMRLKGDGPPYIQVGRSIRYPLSSIYGWMTKQRRYNSTSDATVARREQINGES
ncbi:MAG: helix-turn-helix domain-containing protein [Syntrophales bacterium]